ncbi:MAG: MFS transporter [Candidatus Abyssobacteria bacterium SURF_5]|uniref:MFS transporter n=1 Tax=Abyssobacteria bacterium (strain SURF_5) TaxID=2093360 RepID=A0A3A4NJ27_ABYX5|nr:MAG: MFS transporter [Candidatus Abyssubacteria bacterium SURF_5]
MKTSSTSNWQILSASFLCMSVAAGIGWFVFPVYMTTIEEELGTSRALISLAVVLWAMVGAAFSPVAGGWIDKYGARRVIVAGTLVQIAGTLLLARITSLWQLYVLFIVAALASTANTTIPVSIVISRRFDSNRGTAMGIAMLGMGVGGLVMPIIANVFLEGYGWRGGYNIFAFILMGLLAPIFLWMRPGQDERLATDGGSPIDTPAGGTTKTLRSLTAAEAVRTRTFWFLGSGDFLIGITFTSVTVHMVAFSTAAGISQAAATTAYGVFLAVNSLGIILFGTAADKIKIKWMMVIAYGAAAVAWIFLFRLPALVPLYVFAIIFGVTGGGRTALWPLALGQCFGVAHLGSVLGWLNIPFMIGNAVGPYMAGYIFDASNSYRLLFLFCIGFSLVAAVFISRMRDERIRQVEQAYLVPESSK